MLLSCRIQFNIINNRNSTYSDTLLVHVILESFQVHIFEKTYPYSSFIILITIFHDKLHSAVAMSKIILHWFNIPQDEILPYNSSIRNIEHNHHI